MVRAVSQLAVFCAALCLTATAAEEAKKKPRKRRPGPPALTLESTREKPIANQVATGATHRFLKSGWASRSLAVVGADGKVEWEIPDNRETSDAWLLPDGGLVFSHRDGVTRLSPAREKVWTYAAREGCDTHSCQPLPGGGFCLGESSKDRQWIVELDQHGKEAKRIEATAVATPDARHAFRHVRKTPQGTYLACHMRDGKTYELDAHGKAVRTFPNGHYAAIRLPNGHTLTSGKRWPIAEFDADAQLVWSLTRDDEPKLGFGLRMVCGMQVLPNGNIVACNLLHGGPPTAPELFEITRDKKVVWLIDDDRLNRVASVHILDVAGDVYKLEVLR